MTITSEETAVVDQVKESETRMMRDYLSSTRDYSDRPDWKILDIIKKNERADVLISWDNDTNRCTEFVSYVDLIGFLYDKLLFLYK